MQNIFTKLFTAHNRKYKWISSHSLIVLPGNERIPMSREALSKKKSNTLVTKGEVMDGVWTPEAPKRKKRKVKEPPPPPRTFFDEVEDLDKSIKIYLSPLDIEIILI